MSIIARALGLVLWLASALDVTASTWTNLVSGDASGSWGKAANWSGGIPNATDASADFTTLNITVNSTLTNDAVRTVGWLLFDDIVPGNKWTLTGSNLVLAASATAPEINVISSGLVTTLALGLTGSQGFIKSGAGTLLLSGGTANTLGGSILITNGVLASDNGASLKNVTGAITVGAGAALSVAANFDGNGNNSPIVLNGMGNGTIGALHGLANQTLTGPITLNTDSKISHDWNNFTLNGGISASSGSNNLEMVISVSGQAPLAANGNVNLGLGSLTIRSVSGGASVMLGGTNTLGGVVVLTNGTVLFNSTNAIGGTGPRVTVNDGAVAALNGSDLNPLLVRVATNSAGAIAFNGTSSSAALNFGSWPNLGLGALGNSTYSGVLTPGGGNYRLGGATGTLTVSSGLTNLDARLVVEGNNSSSTVVLTGKHTYGGATLIHSGTLVVTGALSGPLVVQSAGTLSLGPITNIAALTVGNSVTIYGRILMTINRTNSTTADLLSVSSLIAGGTLLVTNLGPRPVLGDSFQLFLGPISNQFLQVVLPALGSGLTWDISQLENNGRISVMSAAPFDVHLGPPTVVAVPANPVYYYANDSVTPYLPNSNGTKNITFWVDGANFRSLGASFDTMGPINPKMAVLSGVAGTWDGGDWLLCAVRQGTILYGFYHAEDYTCKDNFFWQSTGLATSTNDGASWVKQGQIIGDSNPCGSDGGAEALFVAWDHLQSRWLAWGHADGFVSYATNAAVGTWKGWDGAGFNTPMPGNGPLSPLPGLSGSIANCAVAWSTYLNRWVMIYQTWGSSIVQLTTSDNGVSRWTAPTVIYTPGTNEIAGYPQWIGNRADWIGQDCLLVYGSTPATHSGQRRDMVERWVHFGPMTAPSTPTNLTAAGVGTFGTNILLRWNFTPQTDSYLVLRSTNSGGPYSTVAALAISASFPSYSDTNVVYGQIYYYAVQASNSVGLSPTSDLVSASAALPGTNGIVSINFVGGTTGTTNTLMEASETAGVIVSPNWNNAVGASGTLTNLKFGAGAGSGATVKWSSPNTWTGGIPDGPGDYRMMRGYLDGSSPSVTVSNISPLFTDSGYNVYVYCDNDSAAGRTGRYTIGATTLQAVDNATFTFAYTQASNSPGNYLVFRGLKTNRFTLACQGVGGGDGLLRAPVNGLQLVASGMLASNLPQPRLAWQKVPGANQLVLSWPGDYLGWLLQSNSLGPVVTNGWYGLSNTTSATSFGVLMDTSKTNTYYRLVWP